MRIQHNIAAQNSYRQLGGNNSALSKNLEKLSSGYKINRAGDDAAGLAISEKMRSQITGLKKAQDNANDGISLVQTAEGALTEVHSMLNRMVELADQSANGTFDDELDRKNLQKEVTSLKNEIDRIADSTNFNGIKLLDGSMGGAGTTGVTIKAATGTITDKNGTDVKLSVSGVNSGDTVALATGATAGVKKDVLNAADGTFSYTVTLKDNVKYTQDDIDKLLKDSGLSMSSTSKDYILASSAMAVSATTAASVALASANIGSGADELEFKSTVAGGRTNTITVATGAEGVTVSTTGNINISLDVTNKSYTKDDINKMLANAGADLELVSGDIAKNANITGNAALGSLVSGAGAENLSGSLSLQIGDTADSYNKVDVKVKNMSCDSLGIADLDIGSQPGAKAAIAKINSAINSVSSTRGDLGAIQNRLEHTINNLGVTEENMTSAESRIRDTDMAKEMMAYTKNNILVQASQSMLAQANQLPQGVLQLLK